MTPDVLGFLYLDFHYLLWVALPLLVLTGLAQLWVKSSAAKYSKIPNSSGITGAQAALGILHEAGIHDVRVEEVQGFLTDHYDPRHRVVRLSPQIYRGRSIAAVGIAAHECGHAIQHATKYAPLVVRNIAVPAASLGSSLGYVLIFLGFLLGGAQQAGGLGSIILNLGILGFAAVVVFQIINLPVEFNASRRALQVLPQMGILSREENAGARTMLTAAAMTYVAATVAAIAELLYWMWRAGLLGGHRND